MSNGSDPILQVYAVGATTVVGFGGSDVLDNVNLAVCRDEIMSLLDEHNASVVAFDLTGVKLVPSGLLGLLASLRNANRSVHVYNASRDVKDVFEVTHLDQVIELREVEVAGPGDDSGSGL